MFCILRTNSHLIIHPFYNVQPGSAICCYELIFGLALLLTPSDEFNSFINHVDILNEMSTKLLFHHSVPCLCHGGHMSSECHLRHLLLYISRYRFFTDTWQKCLNLWIQHNHSFEQLKSKVHQCYDLVSHPSYTCYMSRLMVVIKLWGQEEATHMYIFMRMLVDQFIV